MTNQIKRKSFIIHKDSLQILKDMTNEQAGIFIKAIDFYQQNQQLPELDFGLKMAIIPFINQFERDEKNYKKTCEARRQAGSIGGKQKVANASKCKQKLAKVADNKNKNKNKNKNESEIKNDLPIFINKDLFNSFIEMRVKIKKPLTDKAMELLIKNLIKFETKQKGFANEALEISIQNSYQGVFEPRPNNNQQQPKQTFLTKQQIEQNQNMQIFSSLQKKYGGDNA